MSTKKKEIERSGVEAGIWNIANGLRGSVDGWDFKNYVLNTICYRQLSEAITRFFNEEEWSAGNTDFDYAQLDDETAETVREDAVRVLGYFIPPSELFQNVLRNAPNNEDLNITMNNVLAHIEDSSTGSKSEATFKGIFQDFDVNSNKLGSTTEERNKKLIRLLQGIADMRLAEVSDGVNDSYGDAYQFLMTMYASDAGKSGGEFFTPSDASELVTRLATVGKDHINKIYDPACGSGSLLLKSIKVLGADRIGHFYGQEINITTYNLCRINMIIHDVGFEKFNIAHGDTLTRPLQLSEAPFDAIVSNPPYSINWEGDDNPILINDPRFTPAGVLAPKSKADMAFIMHSLYCLDNSGTAAIVCFPGIFYRKGAEKKIRQYLVDNNFVDAVVQLPSNLFFGTSIATCILVLKKNKKDTTTVFIDGSNEFVKLSSENSLTAENIQNIVRMYTDRKDVDYRVKVVSRQTIASKDYNLSVSSYVKQFTQHTPIDIESVNTDIVNYVSQGNRLRACVTEIIGILDSYKIPKNCSFVKIGDVAEVGTGSSNKNESSSDGAYPFFVRSETVLRKDTYEFDEEAIIIPGEGGIGEIFHYINGKYALHQRVYRIHFTDTSIDTKFAYYCFKTMFKEYISMNAVVATVTSIRKPMIESFTIPVPPMDLQKKIVQAFDTMQELLEYEIKEVKTRYIQFEYYRNHILSSYEVNDE